MFVPFRLWRNSRFRRGCLCLPKSVPQRQISQELIWTREVPRRVRSKKRKNQRAPEWRINPACREFEQRRQKASSMCLCRRTRSLVCSLGRFQLKPAVFGRAITGRFSNAVQLVRKCSRTGEAVHPQLDMLAYGKSGGQPSTRPLLRGRTKATRSEVSRNYPTGGDRQSTPCSRCEKEKRKPAQSHGYPISHHVVGRSRRHTARH